MATGIRVVALEQMVTEDIPVVDRTVQTDTLEMVMGVMAIPPTVDIHPMEDTRQTATVGVTPQTAGAIPQMEMAVATPRTETAVAIPQTETVVDTPPMGMENQGLIKCEDLLLSQKTLMLLNGLYFCVY